MQQRPLPGQQPQAHTAPLLWSSPVIVTGSQIPNVLFDEEVGLQHKGTHTSGLPRTRSGGTATPIPGRRRPTAPCRSWGCLLACATRLHVRLNPEVQRMDLRGAPGEPLPPRTLPSLLPKPPFPQQAAGCSSARPKPCGGSLRGPRRLQEPPARAYSPSCPQWPSCAAALPASAYLAGRLRTAIKQQGPS